MKRRAEDGDEPRRKVRKEEERVSRTLNVTPIESLHYGNLPSFRLPNQVGFFSLDIDRKFYDDNHQLKYFCLPRTINFNLRNGYEDFVSRDEDVKERLDHLLMWVDKHKDKFELARKDSVENGHASTSSQSASLNTDFITWRGHLTKLLCTPYETREPWKIAATLFKGTIYLSEVETQEACDRRKNMDERQKEMCYWGHSFETFVSKLVSEKQKRKSDEVSSTSESAAASSSAVSKKESSVNNCEAFITVVRTRIEKHSLVFGAEVDCCTSENEPSPGNYIELKTSSHPHTHRQHWSFKCYKLLKWWAQSYLAGIPKIICGFRHHHGKVEELKTYNTVEIPRIVTSDMWDMKVCLNFLNKFLDWVKMVVVKDNPKKAYMLSFSSPFNDVAVEECDGDEHSFLPEWYTKEN